MMRWWNSLSGYRRAVLLSLSAMFVLSVVRILTDAQDLTSSGTISSTLRVGTPILLAGMAGLWAERAGVVNIGIEGMMIVGSWLGGYGAWHWGSWAGIGMALVGGSLVGLLHAVATVRFNVDHVVSGIAINVLAAGSTEYLSIIFFKGQQGGGESQSPSGKGGYGSFDMPFLSGGRIGSWRSPDILGWIEKKQSLPLLPDLAAFARGLTSASFVQLAASYRAPISVTSHRNGVKRGARYALICVPVLCILVRYGTRSSTSVSACTRRIERVAE